MWQELLARSQKVEKLADTFCKSDNVIATELTEALMRLDSELDEFERADLQAAEPCQGFHEIIDHCTNTIRLMGGRSIHSPEGKEMAAYLRAATQHICYVLRERAQAAA